MRINVHTHVFNFRSVLTKECLEVAKHRIKRENTSPIVWNALYKVFKRILDRRYHRGASPLGEFLGGLSLSILKSRKSSISNPLEWAKIGLTPTIDELTDNLLKPLGKDDVVVALPMDIIDKNPSDRDRNVYPEQLRYTQKQALRHPGRVLPFVMVNPQRRQHYDLMKRAIEEGKCVGVKLYPSLTEDFYEDRIRRVLGYCDITQTPVLMHCNDRGFRKSEKAGENCHPKEWRKFLEEFENLKLCFAHFGGDIQDGKTTLALNTIPDDAWANTIVEMMKNEKFKGRVYTDISFHGEMLKNKKHEAAYQKNMKTFFEDRELLPYFLFGTDFHLLRKASSDNNYFNKIRVMFWSKYFDKITRDNPIEFLNLPKQGKEPGENIKRHIKWLKKPGNKSERVSKPASWLNSYL